jgi:hypothetical protein
LAVISLAFACAGRVSAQPSAAQDAIGFGDAPGAPAPGAADAVGFGDAASARDSAAESAPLPSESALSEPPSPFALGATLRLQSALRTESSEPSRLAKLRQVVQLRFDFKHDFGSSAQLRLHASVRSEVDFVYLLDPAAYDPPTYEQYAWLILPEETYLAFDCAPLQLSFGEQIVNFGQGEMLSVLDVINPRDLREPLLTDPADLRLPVLLTRAGLAIERTRAEVVVVHEPFFGLSAPPLGEFSPLRKLLLDNPAFGPAVTGRSLRNQHLPEHSLIDLGATQVHGRVSWSGSGVDLALLAASLLDGVGVPSLPPPQSFAEQNIELPITHPRYSMLGHAGAASLGAFVLRWELAFNFSRPFTARHTDTQLMNWFAVRSHELQGMLGLTYVPTATTSAALEVAQSYLFDDPGRSPELHTETLFPVQAPQFALRFNQSLLRERLNLALFGLLIGLPRVNAWAARAELSYALMDNINVALGFVMYRPSDQFGVFYGFEHVDRVFLNLRWDVSG